MERHGTACDCGPRPQGVCVTQTSPDALDIGDEADESAAAADHGKARAHRARAAGGGVAGGGGEGGRGGGTDGEAEVGKLLVTLKAGRDLIAADRNGTSDPYVIVTVHGRKLRTRTVFKTLCPVWNHTLSFPVG